MWKTRSSPRNTTGSTRVAGSMPRSRNQPKACSAMMRQVGERIRRARHCVVRRARDGRRPRRHPRTGGSAARSAVEQPGRGAPGRADVVRGLRRAARPARAPSSSRDRRSGSSGRRRRRSRAARARADRRRRRSGAGGCAAGPSRARASRRPRDRHRHAARAPRRDLRKRADEALEALRIGELLQPRVVDRCADGDREGVGVAREDGELHPAEVAGDEAGGAARARARGAGGRSACSRRCRSPRCARAGAGAPSAASHPGSASAGPARRRRAPRAARCRPRAARREPQGRPPLREPPTRPLTLTPSRSSTSGRSCTLARSAHSKVVRRHARSTTSSSAGSGSNPIPGGAMSASAISRTPSVRRRSSTSGRCASRTSRRRARKACEWRSCGTPPRCHVRNASLGRRRRRRARRARARATRGK